MKFTQIKNSDACQIRIPNIYLTQSGISETDKLTVVCQKGKITLIKASNAKGEKNDKN